MMLARAGDLRYLTEFVTALNDCADQCGFYDFCRGAQAGIGRLERGEHRWPFEPYRTSLRKILGKATDAELGFFIIQGHARDPEANPEEPGTAVEVTADDLGSHHPRRPAARVEGRNVR